jgi:hypothetical protein
VPLKPIEDVTIEFYTSGLPMSMAMYVKNSEKGTLEEAFQEALKFEKNMMSLKGSSNSEPSKDKGKGKIFVSKPSEDKILLIQWIWNLFRGSLRSYPMI